MRRFTSLFTRWLMRWFVGLGSLREETREWKWRLPALGSPRQASARVGLYKQRGSSQTPILPLLNGGAETRHPSLPLPQAPTLRGPFAGGISIPTASSTPHPPPNGVQTQKGSVKTNNLPQNIFQDERPNSRKYRNHQRRKKGGKRYMF